MRINRLNDVSISCKNFVNFGPVTPELTVLIFLVRHGQKVAYLVEYLRIYLTDFRNLLTIIFMTVLSLGADDGSIPYFPICQGKLPWKCREKRESNEGGLILRAFFARSPDNSTLCSLLPARGRHCGAERAIR